MQSLRVRRESGAGLGGIRMRSVVRLAGERGGAAVAGLALRPERDLEVVARLGRGLGRVAAAGCRATAGHEEQPKEERESG
jgi:hypothetical protein